MVKYSFANFAGISDLHSREACMNHNTKSSFNLPQLVENVLSDTGTLIDNLFADAWRSLNLSSLSHPRRHPQAQRCRCQSGGVSAADVALGRQQFDCDVLPEFDEKLLRRQERCAVRPAQAAGY